MRPALQTKRRLAPLYLGGPEKDLSPEVFNLTPDAQINSCGHPGG